MANFFREYFNNMSDRLGGYPVGGDNTRSNATRWVDILNGLAFQPMQQQGMGLPGIGGGLPGMGGGLPGVGMQSNAQPTQNILSSLYNDSGEYDGDNKKKFWAMFLRNF